MKWKQKMLLGVACCLVTLCALGEVALAGKLDAARKEVSSGDSGGSSNNDHHHDCDDGDGGWEEDDSEGGSGWGFIVLIPFYVPHLALRDHWERHSFYRYPYAGGRPGAIDTVGPLPPSEQGGSWAADSSTYTDLAEVKPVSTRFSMEYGYDFDGVHRPGARFLLEGRSRMGLYTNWQQLVEPLDDSATDYLTLGDANLTFRFAQNARVQFRAGLGGRVLLGRGTRAGGINLHYGVDIFPVRPLAITMQFDMGNLGKAFFGRARIQIGALIRRLEPFLAFDVTGIGDVTFFGPMAGLRFWL